MCETPGWGRMVAGEKDQDCPSPSPSWRFGPAMEGGVALQSNGPATETLLKLYLFPSLSYLTCKMGTTTSYQSFFQDPTQHQAPGGVPQNAAMCCHHPS